MRNEFGECVLLIFICNGGETLSLRALGRKDTVFERNSAAIGSSAVLADTVFQGIGQEIQPLSLCQSNSF